MHDRQAESRSLADISRRKERVEHSLYCSRVHPFAIICDRQTHIRAGLEPRMCLDECRGDISILGTNRYSAIAMGQRLLRIAT